MPEIKSKHSLTAKYVTPATWDLLKDHVTKTANYTLEKAIVCATSFDN
jgi:hypothetical protein